MDKKEIEEVKNEAKILSSISSEFIVKYYSSFLENNTLNIIMEYCEQGDLGRLLNIKKNLVKILNEDIVWKYFIQISLGIVYLHSKKILHRDIKTMNIFLTKNNDVRIGDLGVAKVLAGTLFAKTCIGTPYYLSPEICEELPYNEKSDIWALGCILYELTTFKHPFNANNQAALVLKILKGKYDPISKEYSNDLHTMVDLLLEKDLEKRPSIFDILTNPSNSLFFNLYFVVVIKKAKSLNMVEMILYDESLLSKKAEIVKEIISKTDLRQIGSANDEKSKLIALIYKDKDKDIISITKKKITANVVNFSIEKRTKILDNAQKCYISYSKEKKRDIRDMALAKDKIDNKQSKELKEIKELMKDHAQLVEKKNEKEKDLNENREKIKEKGDSEEKKVDTKQLEVGELLSKELNDKKRVKVKEIKKVVEKIDRSEKIEKADKLEKADKGVKKSSKIPTKEGTLSY